MAEARLEVESFLIPKSMLEGRKVTLHLNSWAKSNFLYPDSSNSEKQL